MLTCGNVSIVVGRVRGRVGPDSYISGIQPEPDSWVTSGKTKCRITGYPVSGQLQKALFGQTLVGGLKKIKKVKQKLCDATYG